MKLWKLVVGQVLTAFALSSAWCEETPTQLKDMLDTSNLYTAEQVNHLISGAVSGVVSVNGMDGVVTLTGDDIKVSSNDTTTVHASVVLSSIYDGNGRKYSEWVCNPATYNGYPIVIVETPSTTPGMVDYTPYSNGAKIGRTGTTSEDVVRLQWRQGVASALDFIATRTRTDNQFLGYQLGSQSNRLLAEATTLLDRYYPEGNVKSAAELTTGIKYTFDDTGTNRTAMVLPFCNTGTATNDNSNLSGRVVIPPFVDTQGNGYITDDGTRYKVVGVSGGTYDGDNTNLTAVIAPNTVTTIVSDAFFACTSLTSVSLPAVTTIGNSALSSCPSLTSVSLPAATSIGESAFKDCPLTSVDFGGTPRSSVPTLVADAFSDVPTTCKIIVPDAQYDAWTTASGWSSLVTQGYQFLRHSEWEYARKYETVPVTRTINGQSLTNNVALTGSDIAVSSNDTTKIDVALSDKASKSDATLNERGFSEWAILNTPLTPAQKEAFYNENPLSAANDYAVTIDGIGLYVGNYSTAELILSDDELSLAFEIGSTAADGVWGPRGTPVATRTALQGYRLGPDDEENPNRDKPLASEAEAEALRQGKQDALTPQQLANIDAVTNKLDKSGGVRLRNDPRFPGRFVINSTASGRLKQLAFVDDVTTGQAWQLITTGSDPDKIVKIPIGPGTLALAAPTVAAAGNLAALDANGNPIDSGMSKDDVESLLFAQYYPEGNIKSAAEFTPGIIYDDPDTTNRTITVKPFCNTSIATNDNSSLEGRVVIPPFVDASGKGYISDNGTRFKVVGVSDGASGEWGAANTKLTAIVAPNTVTSIGTMAFSSCYSLTSVSLPAAMSIGNSAFEVCNSLTSVSLPAAESIGNYAFCFCSSLASVSLPAATSIGDEAFTDCYVLVSVSLPSATSIGGGALCFCHTLASVSLTSATNIGDFAFYGGPLTSISLPAATSIGESAFQDCPLTSVDFGDTPRSSVPSLGEGAFDGVPTPCKIIVPYTQYTDWIAADGWKDLQQEFVRHAEKADKPLTFTVDNLAAFDSDGNPVDSGLPATNVIPASQDSSSKVWSVPDCIMGSDIVFTMSDFSESTSPNDNINAGTYLDFLPSEFGMVDNETLRSFTILTRISTASQPEWPGNFVGIARLITKDTSSILAESEVSIASNFEQQVEFRFKQHPMLTATNSYQIVFVPQSSSPRDSIPMRLIVGSASPNLYVNGNTTWRPVMTVNHYLSVSGQMQSIVTALKSGDFTTIRGISDTLTAQQNSVPPSSNATTATVSSTLWQFNPDSSLGDSSQLLGE